VTPAIEMYIEGHTALGERFISYKMKTSDDHNVERLLCKKAMDNTSYEEDMKKELSDIAKKTLCFDYSSISVEISERIKNRIISLSQWVAILRGSITRDKYSKEITHKPFCERPTRLSKQFYKYLVSNCRFRGKHVATDEEYLIVKDVGVSTVPSRVEDLVHNIYSEGKDKEFTLNEITEFIKLPRITVERLMENLCMLSVLKKSKKEVGVLGKSLYRMDDYILELIQEAEIY
jgi:hypothetical protein